MNPSRISRTLLHTKQNRVNVQKGIPKLGDLTEGVPVIRVTAGGVIQYVRINNVMYQMTYVQTTSRTSNTPEQSAAGSY